MPTTSRAICKAAAAALVVLAAGATDARAAADCATQDSCLEGVMAAARAGQDAQEYALMLEMRNMHAAAAPRPATRHPLPPRPADALDVGNVDLMLARLVGNVEEELGSRPEYRRALVLTYLKTGRIDDARRLLGEAIAASPAYAPFWLDLAVVYARQGQHDRAVSALVVADAWAGDQAEMREAYRQAAQNTTEAGMGPDYTAALQVIAANAAEEAREDAALPPPPPKGSPPDPSRTFATVDFSSCKYPEYPFASLRYEETGTVTLRFLVDAEGRVERVRKTASSGHPQLDNSAALSLAGCRFHAAMVDGRAITTWQPVKYVWKLD